MLQDALPLRPTGLFARALGALAGALLLAAPVAAREPDNFTAALQPFVDKGEVAGAIGLVATKDRVLHSTAVGVSALDSKRPMRTDDIFWIASMTKPIGGIALGMLVDDGKIRFDDPVSKYVPEFASFKAANGSPLTIRQLMTHTGGLGEQMTREPHLTQAQTAAMAARQPVIGPVGGPWSYSTLGIDVLGQVIEVASGMTVDRFLDTRLFRPLGMKDTSFWVKPADLPRYASSYKVADGKLAPTTIPYLYATDPTDRARPPLIGAGLFSTADDVVRVYQMMLNRGEWRGRRLLRPETVAELTRAQNGPIAARPGQDWGLTFAVITDPAKAPGSAALSPGTFGHGGAFGTQSWADPSRGAVYVFMIQRQGYDSSAIRDAFQKAAAARLP